MARESGEAMKGMAALHPDDPDGDIRKIRRQAKREMLALVVRAYRQRRSDEWFLDFIERVARDKIQDWRDIAKEIDQP